MTARVRTWHGNARLCAGIFFLLGALNGCALLIPQTEELRKARPEGLPDRVELTAVPFYPQEDYQCGPAALATVMAHFGAQVTPEALLPLVYLPERRGSLQIEMLAAPRRYGFVSYPLAPRFEDMLREVAAGNPVIVLQDYGVWPLSIWHYAVVVGYDYAQGEVLLRSGEKHRLSMPFAVLEYTWKESDYWAMVAMPPERIPATASESRWLAAVLAVERTGNPHALRTAYQAFLRRWPDQLEASIGLANAHYALHELADAETVLRGAAGRNPDSVAVLNNLAQVLSDQDRNAEALALIARAAKLGGPLAAAVRQTRATILQRLGRND